MENLSKLALSGGCTTLINNPLLTNDSLLEDEAASVAQKIQILLEKCKTDFGQLALLTMENVKDIKAVKDLGVLGFRTYLSPYF